MTAPSCGLYETCIAPLCPLDQDSLNGIWYPDEEICRSRTHGNLPWIRTQRKIARAEAERILHPGDPEQHPHASGRGSRALIRTFRKRRSCGPGFRTGRRNRTRRPKRRPLGPGT